ncbi:hypothetical protein CIRG_06011 [Coccidioides immitis RMSCC 2394]|uniref:Uncharacterized protein n=1 Tax=Coccidioides immitis RMSCC 2394 TaxID=404692 RepID=A0A0J6YF68_COCIT|nr:hypothetical protein CIRG_06011 [Coccidioides immitis RMSCC 2394]
MLGSDTLTTKSRLAYGFTGPPAMLGCSHFTNEAYTQSPRVLRNYWVSCGIPGAFDLRSDSISPGHCRETWTFRSTEYGVQGGAFARVVDCALSGGFIVNLVTRFVSPLAGRRQAMSQQPRMPVGLALSRDHRRSQPARLI